MSSSRRLGWLPAKLNTKLPYNPPTPPSPKSERIENGDSSKYMYVHFHSSSIHSSQKVETASVSIHRGMDKYIVVYPYNRILFSHRKE